MNTMNLKIPRAETNLVWKKNIKNDILTTARKLEKKRSNQIFSNQKEVMSKDFILFLSAKSMLGFGSSNEINLGVEF